MLDVRMLDQYLYGVIGVVLFVAGISLLYGLLKENKEAEKSLGWPSVKGEVASATIREKGRTARNRSSYQATIKYKYVVMQKSYLSQRVAFGTKITGPRNWAQEIVDKYPKGSGVTVFYDPKDPSIATLERAVAKSGQYLLIFSLIAILGGVYLVGMTLYKILMLI